MHRPAARRGIRPRSTVQSIIHGGWWTLSLHYKHTSQDVQINVLHPNSHVINCFYNYSKTSHRHITKDCSHGHSV